MIFIFDGIFEIIRDIVVSFVENVEYVWNVFPNEMGYFNSVKFNIYLFSETGWFTEDIYIGQLLMLIMAIFMFIFLLRLLWKTTKKVIKKVFGVFRI